MASPPNKSEWMIVIILRMIGIGGLLAIPAIFLPHSWMNACHEFLGLGSLPSDPIVNYLARSLSAFYAFLGAIVLLISFDLRRYLPLLKLFAGMAIVLGVVLFAIDLSAGLPIIWTLIEGPLTVIFGAILLVLLRRMDFPGDKNARNQD